MARIPKFILVCGLLTILLQGFFSTHPLPGSPHFVYYLAPWHTVPSDITRVLTAAEPKPWTIDTATVVRDADGTERGRVVVMVATEHERAIIGHCARANLAIVAAAGLLWLVSELLLPVLSRRSGAMATEPQA